MDEAEPERLHGRQAVHVDAHSNLAIMLPVRLRPAVFVRESVTVWPAEERPAVHDPGRRTADLGITQCKLVGRFDSGTPSFCYPLPMTIEERLCP
jgi:hypothetical protein